MTRTIAKLSVYKGRYQRVLGKAFNSRGKLVPKKFLLGTDRPKAEQANAKLEQLWAEVVAEHERTFDFVRRAEIGDRIADHNTITGEPADPAHPMRPRDFSPGPYWRAEALMLADAIRKGERAVAVPAIPGEDASTYVQRIGILRQTYTAVDLVPADVELSRQGREAVFVESYVGRGRAKLLAQMAEMPEPGSEVTLYETIERYAQGQRETEGGRAEAAAARRLKDAHPDVPLSRLGLAALQKLGDYWRGRPPAKRTAKPISIDTVRNHLRVASRLVRWMERQEDLRYLPPRHWEDALKANVRQLRTADEVAALADGVPIWTVEELATLYRCAGARVRMLMLMALNLGGAQSELSTLRVGEIHRDVEPPVVRRVRHKSLVAGQFELWPETLAAIDGYLRRRRARKGADDLVLLTGNGEPWKRQRFANYWNRLLDKVQKEHPDFRRLAFKFLRKTGAELVRRRSDGEIAATYLCHGRPVQSDALSDVYSNRPFDRLAEALRAVRADLQPMMGSDRA